MSEDAKDAGSTKTQDLYEKNARLSEKVDELHAELSEVRRDKRRHKDTALELQKQLEEASAERDSWRQKFEMAPDEMVQKVEHLTKQLRSRDVRDAFRGVESQLNDKVSLDHLFKLSDFDPGAADPAELKVDELVSGWKESHPYLFRQETAPPAAEVKAQPQVRPPGPGAHRGSPAHEAGFVVVKASELQDPGFAMSPGNAIRIAQARKEGRLRVENDGGPTKSGA